MNAQTAHTPRTDAAAFYADEAVNKTTECVHVDFARTLERENAQLVEHNERMRQALVYYAGHLRFDGNGYVFQETETIRGERARAALNPPPTK